MIQALLDGTPDGQMCTLPGGTASAVSVTGDHTTALANIPPADVLAFLVANQS